MRTDAVRLPTLPGPVELHRATGPFATVVSEGMAYTLSEADGAALSDALLAHTTPGLERLAVRAALSRAELRWHVRSDFGLTVLDDGRILERERRDHALRFLAHKLGTAIDTDQLAVALHRQVPDADTALLAQNLPVRMGGPLEAVARPFGALAPVVETTLGALLPGIGCVRIEGASDEWIGTDEAGRSARWTFPSYETRSPGLAALAQREGVAAARLPADVRESIGPLPRLRLTADGVGANSEIGFLFADDLRFETERGERVATLRRPIPLRDLEVVGRALDPANAAQLEAAAALLRAGGRGPFGLLPVATDEAPMYMLETAEFAEMARTTAAGNRAFPVPLAAFSQPDGAVDMPAFLDAVVLRTQADGPDVDAPMLVDLGPALRRRIWLIAERFRAEMNDLLLTAQLEGADADWIERMGAFTDQVADRVRQADVDA